MPAWLPFFPFLFFGSFWLLLFHRGAWLRVGSCMQVGMPGAEQESMWMHITQGGSAELL